MHTRSFHLASLFALAVLPAAGCGQSDADTMQMQVQMQPPGMQLKEPADFDTLDYHRDAKAVMERYCTSCHTAGGIAPFALSDYASVKVHAAAIKREVESGKMPPWHPDDDGVPLRFSRKMRPEDRKLLLDWLAAGSREGDPKAASRRMIPPGEVAPPPRADLTLDMGLVYQPSQKLTDDYRCFILDHAKTSAGGLDADYYLRAGDFLPGNPAIVHHLVVFSVDAANAEALRKKDRDEDGPGYTCFGGAGVGGADFVLAWAPGGGVTRFQDDQGLLLRKGSVFVLQVHYNLSNYSGQGDRTQARLEFAATPPQNLVRYVGVANPNGLKIKAMDPDATQAIAAPVSLILKYAQLPGQDLTIISDFPHMHLLGKRITASVGNQLILSISDWDFHWQGSYQFKQPFVAHNSDLITVECHWDNSPANQPIIGGTQQISKDVSWGEGTSEEMCVAFFGVQYPREVAP